MEHDYFALNFLEVIEDKLLPLFEYIANPSSIDFDDDIIFCLCSLMKKSRLVSPSLRKIFPFLSEFLTKYKGVFGHLLQALNLYIVYGKDFFVESAQNLGLLFEMASASLFKKDPPILLSNNAEGALLLHMVFQNLDGELIKQGLGDILTNAQSRIRDKPMSPTFQRVLQEVFLSAMILDVNLTVEFLKQSGYLASFFTTVFREWRQMRNSYERKLFALAMSNLIFHGSNFPEEI